MDNRDGLFGSAQSGHFRYQDEEVDFSWTLIRKNANSAFIQFLNESTGLKQRPGSPRWELASKYFAASPDHAARSLNTVLVLRDPLDRLKSLFLNKFVDLPAVGRHPGDIGRDACRVTGFDLPDITWEVFVRDYALTPEARDPHVKKQALHLGPLNYNRVVMLESLSELMIELLGQRIGSRYFASKVNPTKSSTGTLNSSAEMIRDVEDWYRLDYELLDSVKW